MTSHLNNFGGTNDKNGVLSCIHTLNHLKYYEKNMYLWRWLFGACYSGVFVSEWKSNRKKTSRRSADGSEVIVPIIPPLQYVLDEIAAPPTRDGFVFPDILKGAETEELRRKYTVQENSNVKDRVIKICHEALHWDKSICPSGTWCRHSFATGIGDLQTVSARAINAGVDMDYISESMGHASSDHAITQIYIEHYPLDIQMQNNSKLLNLGETSERDALLAKLANMSTEELAKLFA